MCNLAEKIKTMLQPGDIFLSRNPGGDLANLTVGYWNHLGIYCGIINNSVIEAQEKWGVIETKLPDYIDKYARLKIIRLDDAKGLEMANHAITFIGTPYRRLASLFVFLRPRTRGENCVSLMRKIYKDVNGQDPRWRIPDNILEDDHEQILELDLLDENLQ